MPCRAAAWASAAKSGGPAGGGAGWGLSGLTGLDREPRTGLPVTGTMDSVMAGSFPGRLHSSYVSRC